MLYFEYWVMVNETAFFVHRDYVKWRGVLFLWFLPSLVDESEKIRHLADYLFENI
jgi:condensin-2 complex subunit D3